MIHMQLFRNDDLKALGVDDSKKLTEEQREELLQKVRHKSHQSFEWYSGVRCWTTAPT